MLAELLFCSWIELVARVFFAVDKRALALKFVGNPVYA